MVYFRSSLQSIHDVFISRLLTRNVHHRGLSVRSSLRLFEASSYKPAPKGPPSSQAQHRVPTEHVLGTTNPRDILGTMMGSLMYRDQAVQLGTAMTAHDDEVRQPAGAGPFLYPIFLMPISAARGHSSHLIALPCFPGSQSIAALTRFALPTPNSDEVSAFFHAHQLS